MGTWNELRRMKAHSSLGKQVCGNAHFNGEFSSASIGVKKEKGSLKVPVNGVAV